MEVYEILAQINLREKSGACPPPLPWIRLRTPFLTDFVQPSVDCIVPLKFRQLPLSYNSARELTLKCLLSVRKSCSPQSTSRRSEIISLVRVT